MHPVVLRRVLKNDGEHLKFSPAVLFVSEETIIYEILLLYVGSHATSCQGLD
jgi:hypothetical protein